MRYHTGMSVINAAAPSFGRFDGADERQEGGGVLSGRSDGRHMSSVSTRAVLASNVARRSPRAVTLKPLGDLLRLNPSSASGATRVPVLVDPRHHVGDLNHRSAAPARQLSGRGCDPSRTLELFTDRACRVSSLTVGVGESVPPGGRSSELLVNAGTPPATAGTENPSVPSCGIGRVAERPVSPTVGRTASRSTDVSLLLTRRARFRVRPPAGVLGSRQPPDPHKEGTKDERISSRR